MILIVLIAFIAIKIVFCYLFISKRYQYWAKRGIFCPIPSFPMGNVQGFGVTRSAAEIYKSVYDAEDGPFCGIYIFLSPTVLVRSPELAKHIMVRDFEYFHDRGFYYNERDDPLTAHMFSIEGSKWKNMRTTVSPAFTTGKLHFMFDSVRETADHMLERLNQLAEIGTEFDAKNLSSRYTTDVIGLCAFGLECNSIKNPDEEFRRNGEKFFAPSARQQYSIIFGNAFPKLARRLKVRLLPTDVSKFFMNVIYDTVRFRKQNGAKRKDLMQLIIDLQEKCKNQNYEFTDRDLAAQAFLFFIGGSETSASAITFTLYELALNPDIQTRLRNEINEVLEKYNGIVTYEAIMEMKYLDRVICESLRKYPPVDNIFRKATRDYTVPGTNHIIEKGTMCLIPVYSFHRNPEHFPDPEKFDPDRFTDENKAKRHPFAFTPFGYGPRFCIGARFAHMQIRLGIVTYIQNFEILLGADTPTKITFCKSTTFLSPDRPIMLKIRKL